MESTRWRTFVPGWASPPDAGRLWNLDAVTDEHWIPRTWTSLSITAPGYGSAEVPLGEEAYYRVELWPGARGRLRVKGKEALPGLRVAVRVFQQGHGMNQVWSDTVVLDSELEADFHVPVQDSIFVSLDSATPSGAVYFEPRYVPWPGGGIIEFMAVEEP